MEKIERSRCYKVLLFDYVDSGSSDTKQSTHRMGTALNVPSSFGHITSTVNSAGLVGTGTPLVLEFSLRLTYSTSKPYRIPGAIMKTRILILY
jgi:hypothetical protein